MFKLFFTIAEAFKADAAYSPVWIRDPLSHPDLEAMDSRSLGDLPFGLFRCREPSDHNPA